MQNIFKTVSAYVACRAIQGTRATRMCNRYNSVQISLLPSSDHRPISPATEEENSSFLPTRNNEDYVSIDIEV